MAEYQLQLLHEGKALVVPVESGVRWETTRKGAPGKLICRVPVPEIDAAEGDRITFTADGKGIFYGYLFTQSRKAPDGGVEWVAYDQLRYLKNRDCYLYEQLTAGELLKRIAGDFALRTGEIAATGYRIPYRVEDGKTLFDIIETALDLTYEQTGEEFVLYDDFGKLTLSPLSALDTPLLLDSDGAEELSFRRSIDGDTANRIKLIHEDSRKNLRQITLREDRERQKQWGVLQYFDHVSGDENAPQLAATLLQKRNRVAKSLQLTGVAGDLRLRAGAGLTVQLNLGGEDLRRRMTVEKAVHRFESGGHRVDLTLGGGDFND